MGDVLSLLELLRQHSVRAEQKERYGDITVERIEPGEYVEKNEFELDETAAPAAEA
ncbi:MAG: hypothetical protein MJ150_03735 [Clostridia bacterium]|nr:hypothetical protein [Clostridia bacterium]